MGGIGGYSGVIPTIWTQLRGWKKEAARAVYQPFILFAHIGVMLCIGLMAFNWNAVHAGADRAAGRAGRMLGRLADLWPAR